MKGLPNYIVYSCPFCKKQYKNIHHIKTHMLKKHKEKRSLLHKNRVKCYCYKCNRLFKSHCIESHMQQRHKADFKKCQFCNAEFMFKKDLITHFSQKHADQFSSKNTSFINTPGLENGNLIKNRSLYFAPYEEKSIEAVLLLNQRNRIRNEIERFIFPDPSNELPVYGKFMMCLHAFFIKFDEFGSFIEQKVMPMSTGHRVITYYDIYENFNDLILWCSEKCEQAKDRLELVSSGWSFQYVSAIDLQFIQLASVGGCNHSCKNEVSHITQHIYDLCPDDANNNDCFFYAIGTALCDRNGLFENITDNLKMKLIVDTFLRTNFQVDKRKKYPTPFSLKQVKAFELDKNFAHFKLSINVFTMTKDKMGKASFWPIYLSSAEESIERINVLLLQPDFQRQNAVGHFVYIRNLSALISHTGKKERRNSRPKLVCNLCLYVTTSSTEYNSHKKMCKNNNKQIVCYPDPSEDKVFYDQYSSKSKESKYIGFLDFEAKMEPQDRERNGVLFNCDNCLRGGPIKECFHSERIMHEQVAMTYSLYMFSTCDKKLVFSRTYSSDIDLMQDFFSTLEELSHFLEKANEQYKTLHWSSRLQELHNKETSCYICHAEFIPGHSQYQKVRDHCHMTPPSFNEKEGCLESKYLGAAHASCNLARQTTTHHPIYVHNLMSYDSNFFFQHAEKIYTQSVSGIPYNGNKLRCINLGKFRFLDSYQILSGGLAELADDLSSSNHDFPLIKQAQLCSEENLKLMLRKSVYPYEWVRSVKQLKLEKQFPPIDAFYTSLKGKTIDENDYCHGLSVFERLKCKDMLQYTELYCKLDTLLLAEIVFTFRDFVWEFFRIPIENYISAPQITWDACLKYISRPIQLMTKPTDVVTVESSLRGGVSFVNNRHETVSDFTKECILYLDANNLYGFAQQMPLPMKNYKSIKPEIAQNYNWKNMSMTQKKGYILQVDLEVPKHLHDVFDNLPLAPSHDVITYDMLSPYSKNTCSIIKGLKKATKKADRKLTSTLVRKERYVLHYMCLKFYLQMGLRLKNIHSCLSFTQRPYLKKYIGFLSKQRAKARSEFKKRLFKLLANSLYGKFIQDVRKYCDVKFAFSEKVLQKHCRNPFYVSHLAVGKAQNVYMIFIRKAKVTLNRLYAVGFSILELSKLHMFSLWYEELKAKFQDNLELILTDTDSFVVKIKNHSKFQALSKIRHIMDFSNYDESHPLYSQEHKKVPGYLKDEYPNSDIAEVVAVKSKCYFLKLASNSSDRDHIVCKGMSKRVIKSFPIELYKKCVYENDIVVKATMPTIRAKKHKLRTVEVTKVCMTSGDDKRYQTCAIHSVPYGSIYCEENECIKCKRIKLHK